MEEKMQVEVVVPKVANYKVKYAAIDYPPLLNDQPIEGPLMARIVYTDQKGELIALTKEQQEQMMKGRQREVFYGEYTGRPVIILEISTMKNSLADAETLQLEEITVEYKRWEVESGTYMIYSFNYENAAYMATILLYDKFTEAEAETFLKGWIQGLKDE
ncbi:hypothetical protein [Brevibacillus panacihumi]|uniref:hypothetical protein n=1 Tax=Brevibacillus panacihumi TaxID=497735 RepID=UPI003D234E2F